MLKVMFTFCFFSDPHTSTVSTCNFCCIHCLSSCEFNRTRSQTLRLSSEKSRMQFRLKIHNRKHFRNQKRQKVAWNNMAWDFYKDFYKCFLKPPSPEASWSQSKHYSLPWTDDSISTTCQGFRIALKQPVPTAIIPRKGIQASLHEQQPTRVSSEKPEHHQSHIYWIYCPFQLNLGCGHIHPIIMTSISGASKSRWLCQQPPSYIVNIGIYIYTKYIYPPWN